MSAVAQPFHASAANWDLLPIILPSTC